MQNQIILSTGSCHKYGLYRFFEVAKKVGFKDIELIIDESFDSQEPDYIISLERKFKLKVVAVHSAMEFVENWSDWKTRLKNSTKLAKVIKAKFLIVHSWDHSDLNYTAWLIQNQKKVMNQAKPVTVVFENATKRIDAKTGVSINPSYHFDVMKEFKSINLDTSHIGTAEMDPIEYFEKLKDKIKYIHFSDSDIRENPEKKGNIIDSHLVPGEGKLPLKKFLKKLKETKYSGPISIELWCDTFISLGSKKRISEKLVLSKLIKAKRFIERYLSS
ncbi:MAG: sugar phosphate isomerase/epimerase [Candidatus Berkelbacteria bacterium]|nr:sugar phosphate isomerase/epimerase [Candidatus Berkelbacteria bacterium]